MYYIRARYYAVWLTKWIACEPIDNEWYNQRNRQPNRNKKRQFLEFTASSYEYCYENPVRFIDPSGEQALTKQDVFLKVFNEMLEFGTWLLDALLSTLYHVNLLFPNKEGAGNQDSKNNPRFVKNAMAIKAMGLILILAGVH